MNKTATQGRPSTLYFQWVTSYELLFSLDEENCNQYQNNGVVKVNGAKVSRASVISLNCRTGPFEAGSALNRVSYHGNL